MMRPALPLAVLALSGLACFKPALPGDDDADTATDDVTTTGDSTGTTTGDTNDTTGTTNGTTGMSDCVGALDILVVLDNSGSMGVAQRRLAEGITGLTGPLDAAGIDWRLGVTTSDNGNPWCPAGATTPEGGKLVLSSCKSRLADFLFGDSVDVRDEACNDICDLDAAALAIQPTSTEVDPNPAPRPWVEHIGGVSNLPAGTDIGEALACLLPQGVNGCGFESQLESSYLALVRAETNNETSYGFLRSNAALLVLLVSDEADCSYNKDWATIFEQDGNKTFWSDPNASFPTSAVCWNAGVTCNGDPNLYVGCASTDKDVNGNTNVAADQAVLHPMARYHEKLAALAVGRPATRVALIGGVGLDGEPVYADVDDTDPTFQNSFGIGPGCSAPDPFNNGSQIQAVPPVRMFELSQAYGGDVSSICVDNFGGALASIASAFISGC